METIAFIHARLAVTVLIYMIACTLWGLALFFRGEGLNGSYWGALAIGEVLVLVQCLVGALALLGGRVPLRTGIHVLYGVVAIISLPAAFFYTRGRDNRYETLIYGLVCAFLAGVAIRGTMTGGG
jgi:hypothetical protein